MGKNYSFKIVLNGDQAVGKTLLRNKLLDPNTKRKTTPTNGAEFAHFKSKIDVNNVTLQIWDLGGLDTFKNIREFTSHGAIGCLCVFDVTRKESFENLKKWVDEIWNNSKRGMIPVILLGNKVDLVDEREVSCEHMQKYAETLSKLTNPKGFEVNSLEISAKTGYNVNVAFEMLTQEIINFLKKDTIKLK